MNVLLAAVNAKYIHSNLGVYCLKAYAKKSLEASGLMANIEICEYTINNQMEKILGDLYIRKPDIAAFSCYIWNISYVRQITADLKKVLPDVKIWLGGPEVSYDAPKILKEWPQADGVMTGEGEETFTELIAGYQSSCCQTQAEEQWLEKTTGLVFRKKDGSICITPPRPVMDLSKVPFVYQDLAQFENRILYYESSRGCPFSCSYCLSSIDKSVRFRDLELVKEELGFFLEHNVPQVKFVDRTFNCKKSHAMAIWQYILEHDNGITNFHFEIAADLLDEEELELLACMRPGLIQLEIGVQTVNPNTIAEIRRKMDLEEVKRITARIGSGRNIHQHLDLIAGLPFEDLKSFQNSFNQVYRMEPQQLQLGFLKVLKGSYMEQQKDRYGLTFTSEPPYEVLSTRWLSYSDILQLKKIEEMVEIHYNSGQFTTAIRYLEQEFDQPFELYKALADWYEKENTAGISQSRLARFELLFQFGRTYLESAKLEPFRDALTMDLYLRENAKSRPDFARDQSPFKNAVRDFFIREEKERRYLEGYEQYDSRQMAKMAHLEVFDDGSAVLFDYKNRDPLTYNARWIRFDRFAKSRRIDNILQALDREYGTEYRCYLNYETPWQLLIAVIMSAQCTDARVNLVTADLFKKYDTLEKFADANLKELEQDIHSIGFYHMKAKNIISCCKDLVEKYDGRVPESLEELTSLAGVGRKTANVIRGNIYKEPSIVVDTHVKRISRKLGLTKEEDPEKIEYSLMKVLPKDHWILWNIHIITLGRTICTARNPKCSQCFLKDYCPSFGGN